MINSLHINNDNKPLSLNQFLSTIKNDTLSHLDVVENDFYLGSVVCDDLKDLDLKKQLQDYRYSLVPNFINDTANWLEVLTVLIKNKANVVAVVSNEGKYLGYYEYENVHAVLQETLVFQETGSVIEISSTPFKCNLSEVTQIVVQNNMQILGLFVSDTTSDELVITIKINQTIQNQLLQDFRRFGYTIISRHKEDVLQYDLEENAKYFDTYLNV
jgi:hypothetical protein